MYLIDLFNNKIYDGTRFYPIDSLYDLDKDMILTLGPGMYTGVRKHMAILYAIQLKRSIKIYGFDLLRDYMPDKSIYICKNLFWKKFNNTITIHNIVELDNYQGFYINKPLDGFNYFDCSTEELWKHRNQLTHSPKILYADKFS